MYHIQLNLRSLLRKKKTQQLDPAPTRRTEIQHNCKRRPFWHQTSQSFDLINLSWGFISPLLHRCTSRCTSRWSMVHRWTKFRLVQVEADGDQIPDLPFHSSSALDRPRSQGSTIRTSLFLGRVGPVVGDAGGWGLEMKSAMSTSIQNSFYM